MGYFKKKGKRTRERELKGSVRRGNLVGNAETALLRPFKEWRFVRLHVPAWHWSSSEGQGIFRVSGVVQEKKCLSAEQSRALQASLRWFNRRLPVPKLHEGNAVFWFKYSARECRRRVAQLARLLRTLGVSLTVTETDEPGQVVYEDSFQIAAIPSDLMQPKSRSSAGTHL